MISESVKSVLEIRTMCTSTKGIVVQSVTGLELYIVSRYCHRIVGDAKSRNTQRVIGKLLSISSNVFFLEEDFIEGFDVPDHALPKRVGYLTCM